MRHLHKNTLRILYIVLALVLLVQPGLAAGESYFERAEFHPGAAAISVTIQSEGFLSKAYWDYQQYSIGYGTAYVLAEKMFPNNPKDENGRVTITEEQALELLKSVMDERASIVNNYLNRYKITVNQNQFDALLLFTYGVGEGWMYGQNSDGTPYKIRTLLEDMHPEEWTKELVHAAFGGWVNAGGEVLPGLVTRRATEADLFLTPAGTAWGGGTESENAFKDLQTGAWYVSFVTEASKLGIMTGRGGGVFDPEGKTTRAELVKTLANYTNPDFSQYTSSPFRDVPMNAWFAGPVVWAADQHIVNGKGDGSFGPDEPISRERICNIIARYLRGQGVESGTAGITAFLDEKDMAKDAVDDIYFCASLGIVSGRDTGNFDPKGEAKRSEVAKMLTSMIKVLEHAKTSESPVEEQPITATS